VQDLKNPCAGSGVVHRQNGCVRSRRGLVIFSALQHGFLMEDTPKPGVVVHSAFIYLGLGAYGHGTCLHSLQYIRVRSSVDPPTPIKQT
jgi:hypothetical protein